MRPAKTETTNSLLTLPDDSTGRGDLPVEVCVDPDGKRMFETTWIPTPGERASIAAGANIALHVWGNGHPPVSVGVTKATIVP